LGISLQVKFLGQVLDTQGFYRSLTHYCHISEYEGVPNSLMEAMSFGLPCVVSDIPGNRELILDHINGLLVSLESPTHLTSALRTLLADQDESRRLGDEARKTVFKTHQPRFTVEALLPIYVEDQADIQSFIDAGRRANNETLSEDKNGQVSRSAKG
jgi:glycosyltransferase involved in cell wall biosynthesis